MAGWRARKGSQIKAVYKRAALLASRRTPITLKLTLLAGRAGWGWPLKAEKQRRRIAKQGRGGTSYIRALED